MRTALRRLAVLSVMVVAGGAAGRGRRGGRPRRQGRPSRAGAT